MDQAQKKQVNELVNKHIEVFINEAENLTSLEGQCFTISLITSAVFVLLANFSSRKDAFDIINSMVRKAVEMYDEMIQDKI